MNRVGEDWQGTLAKLMICVGLGGLAGSVLEPGWIGLLGGAGVGAVVGLIVAFFPSMDLGDQADTIGCCVFELLVNLIGCGTFLALGGLLLVASLGWVHFKLERHSPAVVTVARAR